MLIYGGSLTHTYTGKLNAEYVCVLKFYFKDMGIFIKNLGG